MPGSVCYGGVVVLALFVFALARRRPSESPCLPVLGMVNGAGLLSLLIILGLPALPGGMGSPFRMFWFLTWILSFLAALAVVPFVVFVLIHQVLRVIQGEEDKRDAVLLVRLAVLTGLHAGLLISLLMDHAPDA